MRPISTILSSTDSFELQLDSSTTSGSPLGIKQTPTRLRVPMSELELTYLKNPVIFNGINKIIQTLMSSPHHLQGGSPKGLKFFQEFTENIGWVGNTITWEELLSDNLKFECIYGWSWVENILEEKTGNIVDWDLLDPKRMDYLKENSNSSYEIDPTKNKNKVLLDKFGRPLGYTMNLDIDYKSSQDPAAIPEPLRKYVTNNQVYFSPDRICLFKLFRVGDSLYPVGLVEPIYQDSLQKLNSQDAATNNIARHGTPLLIATLGDTNHEPNPEQTQSILTKLKELNSKSELAIPYYYDIKYLESNSLEKIEKQLLYHQNNEIAGMGIPKPYALGSGEATNRATLNNQDHLFQLSLKNIVDKTTASIKRFMFAPLAKQNGFKTKDIPVMRWDATGAEEVDRKIRRILEYVKNKIITPEDAKKIIAHLESYDQDEINEILKK